MAIYQKGKNKKYYARGRVNGERYNLLLAGATNRKEATELDNAIRFEISQRQHGIIPHKVKEYTFSQVSELYNDYTKQHNKDYKRNLQMLDIIKNYFNNKKLAEISPRMIELFIKFLREEKLNKRNKQQGLSNARINRYLAILKVMFNLAIKEKYISENPMKSIKKLQESNNKIRYLTMEEEQLLFENLPKHTINIVKIALNTGLRLNNILKMQWKNVDLRGHFIEVLKQDNKGKKIIQIPMNATVFDILNNLPKDNAYVFVNPKTDKPYTTIHKAFKSACKKANIENFRFHDLRHTVATRLVNSGANIRNIQDLLAHSSIRTTERYMHPTHGAKLQMVKILNNYTSKKGKNDAEI